MNIGNMERKWRINKKHSTMNPCYVETQSVKILILSLVALTGGSFTVTQGFSGTLFLSYG